MATKRILQSNLLLWVDANIKQDAKNTQHTLQKLRAVVHDVHLFKRIDDCVSFLNKIKSEQVLVIASEGLGRSLVTQIHHLAQVKFIFIFGDNLNQHQSWITQWSKIRGVHNQIKTICEALRTAVKQSNEDLTPISFVTPCGGVLDGPTVDLNQLEPSFMYTTLFKRILIDMKHEPDERKAIVKLCRAYYANNSDELKIVEEFNRDYRPDKAIWWYTRECFTYQMLNRALCLLESDIIVDMGFFIHDLHRQLEELHQEQFADYQGPTLILYRGQALSVENFSKLKKSRGGLLAFNNFLSTSRSRLVSLSFAEQSSQRDGMVGIFFVLTVDPTFPSAIFADINKYSYFAKEDEVLFSMHTVFRIEDIIQLDKEQQLFEVRLMLTSDADAELSQLTDRIEKDMGDEIGWDRLASVLLDLGQVNKAEELYWILLDQHPHELDQGHYYHQLGLIKGQQGAYEEALTYYNKALAIKEKTLPGDDPSLATSYSDIGLVHDDMGDYSQALSYLKKALAIEEENLSVEHPSLAISYNNIGLVYKSMGDYSQALSYLDKALPVQERTLLANHPSLATAYNNIGSVYNAMGDHSQALSYYNKALTIQEKTLPANHSSLAISYNNIGLVYDGMKDYSQALSYYNKALAIEEKTLPGDHPSLAISYNNTGLVYKGMGDYPRALSYLKKALTIQEKSLAANHPSLANSYSNIGLVYNSMGDYSQALSYYSKALAIQEKTLPADHPSLGTSHNNIGATFFHQQKYYKAQSHFEKALSIRQRSLPHGHRDIQSSQTWLESVYTKLQN